MSRTQRAIYGTLTSFLQYGLQIATQVLLVPVTLHVAGQQTLGAYAVLIQALGYLALLDFGFTTTLSRYLAQSHGLNDQGKRFADVLATGRSVMAGMNLLVSALLIVLAFYVGPLLKLDPNISRQAKLGVLLLAGWSVVRTPFVLQSIALVASQDLAFCNMVSMGSTLIRLVGSLVMLKAGLGLVGLMLANILAEVWSTVASSIRFRRKLGSQIRLGWGIRNRELFLEMCRFGGHVMMINLATRLVLSTDNLVIGGVLGAVAASIYYATQTPPTAGWMLVNGLANSTVPAINELIGRRDLASLRAASARLNRYALLMAFPLAIGILLLNEPLIALWVGAGQYGGRLMNISLAVFAFLMVMDKTCTNIVIADGEIRALTVVSVLEGVANLVLSIILAHTLGLGGVMLATVIAHFPSFCFLLLRARKILGIGYNEFLFQPLCHAMLPCMVSCLVLVTLRHLYPPARWFSFATVAGIFLIVHALACFFLGLTPEDKSLVRTTLAHIRNLAGIRGTRN